MTPGPFTTLLDEALDAWRGTREGLLDEAAEIPDERWDWCPVEGARSVAELLRHVLESGLMAVGELSREDGDFTRQGFPDFVREHAGHLPERMDPPALREHLRRTLEDGERILRERGEIHMLQTIRRFDGLPGTRLAWFNHHVDHESHHRGQLALYVRLTGTTPALTRRIQGG